VAKVVVVSKIAIEPGYVSDEFFPFFLGNSSIQSTFLQELEVFACKISLEKQKEHWGLVTDLMVDHFTSSPRSLAHIISIVSLFVIECLPSFVKVKLLYFCF
jgi:hypothetical protein